MRIIKNLKFTPYSLSLTTYPLILAAFLLVCAAGPARAVVISTHSAAGCAFPDTAQSSCYNATVGMACPTAGQAFYGQDAQYANSASTISFTIHNGVDWGGTATSSVTVDNRTGLMWVTNTDDTCATCPGGYVSSGTYTWLAALPQCENAVYAGFSDWRLPNIRELVSIVDYSRQSPSINKAYFLNTQSNYYWSSTTYVPNSSYAWYVYFSNGYMYYNVKTSNVYVRCVRGGP